MANLFTTILNMSLTACIIILIVLLARQCLKKVPKIFSYVLWSVVLFRLLCPVSISLPVSILAPMSGASTSAGTSYTASMEYISLPERNESERTQQPVPGENGTQGNAAGADEDVSTAPLSPIAPETATPPAVVEQKMSAGEIVLTILGWVWVAGMVGVLGMTAWQTISLKRRLADACIVRGNIFESDKIDTAFILGIINPKIYLPLGLPFDVQKAVVAHEQTHQRRGDHLVKLVSYIALAIHWFNPLVWLSFKLMCDDMEKSCDEAVIRTFYNRGYPEKNVKKGYSEMLFALGGGKQHIFSPVSFAEHSTKERILNVVNYTKLTRPVVAVIAAAIITVVVLGVVNPVDAAADLTTLKNKNTVTIGGETFDRNVTSLSLKGHGITDISELSACTELLTLDLSDNNISDVSALAGLKKLRELHLSNNNISDLSMLSNLDNINRLYIDGNPITDYTIIKEIDALNGVSVSSDMLKTEYLKLLWRMSSLRICGSTSGAIEKVDISVLQDFMALQFLTLKNCIAEDFSAIDNFYMTQKSEGIYLRLDVNNLDDYGPCGLGEINKLGELEITYDTGNSLSILEGATKIKTLYIVRRDYILPQEYALFFNNVDADYFDESIPLTLKDFSGLKECTGLTNLNIVGLGENGDFDLSVLSSMPQLQYLSISGEMDNLDFVKYAPDIISLEVDGTFTDISALSKLNKVKYLDLYGDFDDISVISSLTRLRQLTLYGHYDDLSPLSPIPNLEQLTLSGHFSDLSDIKNTHLLWSLHIISDKLDDLSALAEFDNTKDCWFRNFATTDFSPMADMDLLRSVYLMGCNVDNLDFVTVPETLKRMELWNCVVNDASALNQPLHLIGIELDNSIVNGFNEDMFRQNNENCSLSIINPPIETPNDESVNQNTHEAVQLTIGDVTFWSDATELDFSGQPIEDFSPLTQCTQLVSLDISETGVTDLSFLSSLTSLQNLDISNNAERVITTGPEQKHLIKTIENEGVIGSLVNLRSLNISWNGIEDITFVSQLPLLEHLDITHNFITDISCLETNASLKQLYIYGNKFDNAVFPHGLVALEELYALGCNIADFSGLSDCLKMRVLDAPIKTEFIVLSNMRDLECLYVYKDTTDATDVSTLSSLSSLKELYFYAFSQNGDYSFLSKMKKLEILEIGVDPTFDLSDFTHLANLKILRLYGASDISPIAKCNNLQKLTINFGGTQEADISAVAALTKLTYLDLQHNEHLSDISALNPLNELEYLNLHNCNVRDISALSSMNKLVFLDLDSNNVTDISPLFGLDGFRNGKLSMQEGIWENPRIHLMGNPLTSEQLIELNESLNRNCSIYSEDLSIYG